MQCLLNSSQPTINVCAKIKCPFFDKKSSSSHCCTRYLNSTQCHLRSVFAFKSARQGLFTANESELVSVKMANDGWIAKDNTSQMLLGNCNQKASFKSSMNRASHKVKLPCFSPYTDSHLGTEFPETNEIFAPISISLLNSIHFEEYWRVLLCERSIVCVSGRRGEERASESFTPCEFWDAISFTDFPLLSCYPPHNISNQLRLTGREPFQGQLIQGLLADEGDRTIKSAQGIEKKVAKSLGCWAIWVFVEE